jgi:hypothetical protein
MKLDFSRQIFKNTQISNFTICSVRTVGRTDRYDEVNSRFSKFYERAKNRNVRKFSLFLSISQCTIYQPISVADIGSIVSHDIIVPTKSVILNFALCVCVCVCVCGGGGGVRHWLSLVVSFASYCCCGPLNICSVEISVVATVKSQQSSDVVDCQVAVLTHRI